jgi:anti-anti-sigma factor
VLPAGASLYDGLVTAAHLSVEEQRSAAETTLVLRGEIDMATAGELRAATTNAMAEAPGRLVLDFADVTFCDSQGLSTLISLHREVAATGGRLVLINVGEFMARLLEITGLRSAFEVEESAA